MKVAKITKITQNGVEVLTVGLIEDDFEYDFSWDWLMPVALRIVKKHGIDCISKRYGFSEIYWEVVKAIKFIKNHNETKKEL